MNSTTRFHFAFQNIFGKIYQLRYRSLTTSKTLSSFFTCKKGDLSFKYQIKNAEEKDIPKIMQHRKELRMPDCASCLKTWIKIDPEGFFVTKHESGEILGAISQLVTEADIVFSGLQYVIPEYRGLGISSKMLSTALARLGDRNFVYYSVPENLTKYNKKVEKPPYKDFTCIKNIVEFNVNYDILSEKLPQGVEIIPFTSSLLEAIYEYDSKLVGYKRFNLLKLSCNEENSQTFVAMKDGNCLGYGTVKLSCLGGARVGPLYADDNTIAEALLKTLIRSFSLGNGFAMMTVGNNSFANKLMRYLDVPATQHLSLYFSKKPIEADTRKIFALFDINVAPY